MIPMRVDLLLQATKMVSDDVFGPQITLADIASELRKVMGRDPLRAERAVGALYGGVFKRKESARNPWVHPDTGVQLVVDDT